MVRSDSLRVNSIIRDLMLNPNLYPCLLHFFRASSWEWNSLFHQWTEIVAERAPLRRIAGRAVLIGDGTKRAADGKYMPRVKKMAQESESASKSAFIHGHFFVLLVSSSEIQQNFSAFRFPFRFMMEMNLSANGKGMNRFPMWCRCFWMAFGLPCILALPYLYWTGIS